jgi:hypothetical protein
MMDVKIADTFFSSLKKCFRPWWRPRELWYQFKCFAWHRYSTVRPRRLPHTWVDRSDLLPHLMFEVLSQFVENECSPGCVEWHCENSHKITRNGEEIFVRDELQAIYDWWNVTYNKEYPEKEEALLERMMAFEPDSTFKEMDNPNFVAFDPEWNDPEAKESYESALNEYTALQKRAEDEQMEFMHRLVAVSQSMWT